MAVAYIGKVPKMRKGKQVGFLWYYTVSGNDPATGQRIQVKKRGFRTKRLAELAAEALTNERNQGYDITPDSTTVKQYIERWLRDYAAPNVAASTCRRYAELLNTHVVPVIGDKGLKRLRPADVQAVNAAVVAKGRSAKTALNVYRVLHEALEHAVKWQVIPRNVANLVDAPRAPVFEAPALELQDVHALFAAADELGSGTLVRFAVRTGLRQGEILSLLWMDVDTVNATASVRKGKTASARRLLALSPKTVNLLQAHRLAQLKTAYDSLGLYQELGLVFPAVDGNRMTESQVRILWAAVRARAAEERTQLKAVRFHDLRHTHATLGLRAGVPTKVMSARLGHSRVGITMDTYQHVIPVDDREAAAAIDRLLDA